MRAYLKKITLLQSFWVSVGCYSCAGFVDTFDVNIPKFFLNSSHPGNCANLHCEFTERKFTVCKLMH